MYTLKTAEKYSWERMHVDLHTTQLSDFNLRHIEKVNRHNTAILVLKDSSTDGNNYTNI